MKPNPSCLVDLSDAMVGNFPGSPTLEEELANDSIGENSIYENYHSQKTSNLYGEFDPEDLEPEDYDLYDFDPEEFNRLEEWRHELRMTQNQMESARKHGVSIDLSIPAYINVKADGNRTCITISF